MKKILLAATAVVGLSIAAFAGSASATTAFAGGTFAYNIGVTNDYVFRGITQNGGEAALQGGIDYTNKIFYAGTWASNVDFAAHELDLYAGVRPTLGKASFDFGLINYGYADKSLDLTEAKAAVSYPVGKGTLGAAFYDDIDAGKTFYYEVNGSYPINDKWSVSGALGEQSLGSAKYTTGNIGATYAINSIFSLDLRYSDTNIPEIIKASKPRVAVLLKASF